MDQVGNSTAPSYPNLLILHRLLGIKLFFTCWNVVTLVIWVLASVSPRFVLKLEKYMANTSLAMVVYGLWMLAYTASVLLPWARVHAISGGNASVLCSSVVLTHIVLSVSASAVVIGCSVLLYCHILCQEEEHGWYLRVWVQPSASCRTWNACKSRFCLPKYIASLLFTLYILIYWFINCLFVFRFTRNQRKRQTLYHLWHKEIINSRTNTHFWKQKFRWRHKKKLLFWKVPYYQCSQRCK
jgi:hypothetical protein